MERILKDSFKYKGYQCAIIEFSNNDKLSMFQNYFPSRYLCGYVAIPYWHSAYEEDYKDLRINCHGGLTFSGHNLMGQHYPSWWIGFDCAHADDISNPKNVEFVKKLCRNIVNQLITMEEN